MSNVPETFSHREIDDFTMAVKDTIYVPRGVESGRVKVILTHQRSDLAAIPFSGQRIKNMPRYSK